LLAEIVRSDLSTVHLAQKQGALGFQRLVAIKRLSEVFARQPDFVQLMLDEARIGSRLHHANVVGILDVGNNPSCYVVMDYVEGDSLGTLLARAGNSREPRFIAPVVVDMLNGLHAVHTAIDENGAHLGVVHQAPTAHHVLVGIDGTARLTDFSQARSCVTIPSAVRDDRLRVSHMAPEHALTPEHVDHRADLFVAGIVLWEALTGERLFAADTEELTFQNLVSARVPKPSDVGLRPPRCFDHVVGRALERDPERRYQSALEMARDLRDAALNQALYATAGELGQWVTSLVGPELAERRKRAVEDPSEPDGSTSGFFSAAHAAKENPYQSGRIYGGSYSHVDRGQDVVRSPASVRAAATLPSLPPLGPLGMSTASQNPPQRAPDRAIETPSGARISSRPRSSVPPVRGQAQRASSGPPFSGRVPTQKLPVEAPAPRESAPISNLDVPSARAPTLPYEEAIAIGPGVYGTYGAHDAENTNPGGFVPARPGGRRDRGAPSPGAYSEHKTSTAVFDEVDTSRLHMPPSPSSYPPPAMTAAASASASPQKRGARTEDPLPRVTEQDARASSGRRDSTPLRLTLPEGPVGQPLETRAEDSVPPPPRAPRLRLGDVITPPSSLAPSMAAARTKNPEPLRDTRARGFGFWIGTGMLTGIIALAAFVGVRNWAAQRHAAGPGGFVSMFSAPVAEPLPVGTARAPVEPVPAAPAIDAPPAPKPSEESPALAAPSETPADVATSSVAANAQPQSAPVSPAPLTSKPAPKFGAKAKWMAKGKKPLLGVKSVAKGAAAGATPQAQAPERAKSEPSTKLEPAAKAGPQPKLGRKANIPENPY
jgi:serine/threonine-protein kinase